MSELRTGLSARVALAAAVALLAALAIAAPARAHNPFLGSTPETGATVTEARTTITLEFTETIDERFIDLAVSGPDGQAVELGKPAVIGGTLTAQARFTASGEHTIGYRVMSDDGHPVEGEIAFPIELPAETDEPASSTPDEPESTNRQQAATGGTDGPGWLPTALLIGAIAALGALALILPRRR